MIRRARCAICGFQRRITDLGWEREAGDVDQYKYFPLSTVAPAPAYPVMVTGDSPWEPLQSTRVPS